MAVVAGRSTRSLDLIVSYWGNLWRTEVAAFSSLAAFCFVYAVIVVGPSQAFSSDQGRLAFGLPMIYGMLPALCLFAPSYAWIRTRGHASTLLALGCGIAALLIVPFLWTIPLVIVAASTVAIATHTVMKFWRFAGVPVAIVGAVIVGLFAHAVGRLWLR
jgi:hypothetical protein